MTGPASVWFGVGFGASAMKDSPWALIVDGSGNVTERKLKDQSGGDPLPPSVTLLRSSVEGGNRTVVLKRALAGTSKEYGLY